MCERNLRVTLAYDGTDFCGWQVQASDRTVQGTVEEALSDLHGEPVRVRAAGRTDSGVHARGQVISFGSDSSIPTEVFSRAMNSRLPRDVRVVSCVEAPEGFHARYSARRREYKYYLEPAEYSDPFSRRFALTLKSCPPVRTLNACARKLVGTHDFTTFSAAGDQSASRTRTISSASFYPEGRFIVFRIVGNAFLWKMVRSIVGTVLEVCKQPNPEELFADRMEARDRRRAGTTAPAKGLFLAKVCYDE